MLEHRCPFWLGCLTKIEGPGVDGVYSISHLFSKRPPGLEGICFVAPLLFRFRLLEADMEPSLVSRGHSR